MKTRFDGKIWVMAYGVAIEVKEMETAHLLNTVKMLVQKPARVQAMLVDDIERATFADPTVWTPTGEGDKFLQQQKLKYLKIGERWDAQGKDWIPVELSHYYDTDPNYRSCIPRC